jgi:hypothetical protein
VREEGGASLVAPGPIFVDSTGRRGRLVRRICWALGLVMAAYVAVVILALVGPPGLSQLAIPGLGPVLPGSGAPDLRTPTGQHGAPASVLSPRPSVSPRPRTSTATAAPGSTTTRASGAPTASPVSSPPASGHPTPAPTGPASSPPTGAPTSPVPRASPTPPGQTSPHPTPRSTHARVASPQPSPTP